MRTRIHPVLAMGLTATLAAIAGAEASLQYRLDTLIKIDGTTIFEGDILAADSETTTVPIPGYRLNIMAHRAGNEAIHIDAVLFVAEHESYRPISSIPFHILPGNTHTVSTGTNTVPSLFMSIRVKEDSEANNPAHA